MRLRVLGVLALVVATAGCSGLVGGGSSAPTLTPAPVPTVESTPADPRIGVAPGVSTRAVTHPSYLADRHVAVTNDSRYVVTVRRHETRRLDGVVANPSRVQRIAVENATVYRRDTSALERRVGGAYVYRYGYGEYANGRAKYVSWLGDDDTDRVFRRYPDPSTRPQYAEITASSVRRYLDLESATVSRYDVADGDARYYLVTGTRSTLGATDVENYSARAVIRADGFVRRLNVTYDAMDRGIAVSASYSFAYRKVGTATVAPPAWIDEASVEFADERGVPTTESASDGAGTAD